MRRPLLGACLFFGLLVFSFYVCVPYELPDYGKLDGKQLCFTGKVAQIETKEYFGKTNIIYTLKDVWTDEGMAEACYEHGQIYCYTSEKFANTYIGTKIAVKGDFSSFKGPENPGSFDSQFYYHILGVGGSLKNAQLISSDGAVSCIREALHRLRFFLIQKSEQLFSKPYNGIIQAVLLGYKGNLDADMKQLYKEGGMLHIMTISGMHISMLGMGCVWVLKKLRVPGRVAAVIGALVVVLYGMMIGMQVATLRAVLMFCMRMLAKLLRRTYDAKTALGLSAAVLLLKQPMYLFHSGFLLSYGSVLGMIVVMPVLNKLWECKNKFVKGVYERFLASVGILLATLPLQLYFFYEYSLYSILINFIVLPLLPFVVGIAVVVLALPMTLTVTSSGAMPVGAASGCLVWVVERLLAFYEWVCDFFGNLPAHAVVAGAPKVWQIIGYYVVLAVCLAWIDYWKRNGMKLDAAGIWQTVLMKGLPVLGVSSTVLLILFWRPLDGFQCHFLSVGQGDCAVIREGDSAYLVDCGSSSKKRVAEDILLPFLKYYGISKVDGVFLSHADEDHINGIVQWLEDYEHSHIAMKSMILPALDEEILEGEFGEVLALCEARGVPVFTLSAGDALSLGNLRLEVLNPPQDTEATGTNECSQVLFLEYKNHSILFTGDISSKTETDLLHKLNDANITVLKVAHHGSKYSSSASFLRAIKPQVAILSYGAENSYGHPHKEVLDRLNANKSYVMETAKSGAITILFEDEVRIKRYLE